MCLSLADAPIRKMIPKTVRRKISCDLSIKEIATPQGLFLKTPFGVQNCVFGAIDSPGFITTNLRDSSVNRGHGFPPTYSKDCAEKSKRTFPENCLGIHDLNHQFLHQFGIGVTGIIDAHAFQVVFM